MYREGALVEALTLVSLECMGRPSASEPPHQLHRWSALLRGWTSTQVAPNWWFGLVVWDLKPCFL